METKSRTEGIPYSDREDFAVDKDVRSEIFDKWLIRNGFTYVGTTMSQSGGKRKYKHIEHLCVALFRVSNCDMELSWYIEERPSGRELKHGTGLAMLSSNINKLLS